MSIFSKHNSLQIPTTPSFLHILFSFNLIVESCPKSNIWKKNSISLVAYIQSES